MAQEFCGLPGFRMLLSEVGFPPQKTMELYCDNQAARRIASNLVDHDKTKHAGVDRYIIKKRVF